MSYKIKCTHPKEPMSKIRRTYFARLVGRCVVLALSIVIYIIRPEWLNVLNEDYFFREFSPLHILWIIWVIDMICQLIPVKDHTPLGSQKIFKQRFKPIREKINYHALKEYVVSTTKAAYKIFIIWSVLILVLGVLYQYKILSASHLFLISVTFYVCDLICVLIWCPFRLIMKNRCCTTCRIFNWDHLMMFTPLIYVGGFYATSLMVIAFLAWLVWELCVMLYPERFWEKTNLSLKCSECTDKLCTQYCQKLR